MLAHRGPSGVSWAQKGPILTDHLLIYHVAALDVDHYKITCESNVFYSVPLEATPRLSNFTDYFERHSATDFQETMCPHIVDRYGGLQKSHLVFQIGMPNIGNKKTIQVFRI